MRLPRLRVTIKKRKGVRTELWIPSFDGRWEGVDQEVVESQVSWEPSQELQREGQSTESK